MKSKRQLLAKRALRAPIVITVAGAGMIAGTTGCQDENELIINPPAAECPASEPTSEPCESGLECQYGDCYGNPTTTAKCIDGRWSVAERSCNPPMPQCPADAPIRETACGPIAQECTYGDCGGVPTTTARCVAGTWEISSRSCNPPIPECPTEQPVADTACEPGVPSCEYGDCYGEPTTTAQCVDGTWKVAIQTCNPPPPECPTDAPTEEAACEVLGQKCSYGDCDGAPTLEAECTEDGWSVAERSCNPPTPL